MTKDNCDMFISDMPASNKLKIGSLTTMVTEESEKRVLDIGRLSEMSTPLPSPAGSKSGKSDTDRPKQRRKRKEDAERKENVVNKKGCVDSLAHLCFVYSSTCVNTS